MQSYEWFVAWRYLRSKGSKVGRITMVVGVGILLSAIGFHLLQSHFNGIHPFQLTPLQEALKNVGRWGKIGALATGILVVVFGFFHSRQSIFTTISSFGVFLGTAALCIVLSVMNGFEADLRKKILGSNSHLLVTKERGEFTEWREAMKALEGLCVGKNCIVAMTPYLTSEVVVAADTNYGTAIIKGIDPATVVAVTDLGRNISQGSLANLAPIQPDAGPAGIAPDDNGEPKDFSQGEEAEPRDFSTGGAPDGSAGSRQSAGEGSQPPGGDGGIPPPSFAKPLRPDPRVLGLDGILVGRELARNLHLYVGEEVQVVSPLGRDTPTGQVPRVRPFRVAGMFFSGMYEYDQKYVYVALPALQSFLSLGDEVNGIEIKITDMDETEVLLDTVRQRLPRMKPAGEMPSVGIDDTAYLVQDWKEINRSLFASLKLEKIMMFGILTLIIVVASLSIVLNLIMVVVEKQREIAILKSLGASSWSILWVFVLEGLFIGVMGTLLGIAVGVGACVALETFGFPISSEVYYIDRLPVDMDPTVIAMVAAAGVLISMIATIYPALVGARLRPVDGLRK